MRLDIADDGRVDKAVLAFGGLAATTQVAKQASAYLHGKFVLHS